MRKPAIGISIATAVATWPAFCVGQVVQLPTVRTFRVHTTVTVPDRGAALLGGNTRSVATPTRRRHSTGRAHVTAQIIDSHEMDAAVLAEARRRRTGPDSAETVAARRAAYLSRNMGGRPVQRDGTATSISSRTSGKDLRIKSRRLTYDELMRRGRAAMASGRYREAKQYFMAAASAGARAP